MERDPADILDRYIISVLKAVRIGNECVDEFNLFHEGFKELLIKYPIVDWFFCAKQMYEIHDKIWRLEWEIRDCKLDNDIMEVGRRAIEIRDWNKQRVKLKNEINGLCGIKIKDIKNNHLSE